MNDIQRYSLYPKLLKTQPVTVVRKDSQKAHIFHIEMKYNMDNQILFVNAFFDKKEKTIIAYSATLNDNKGKRISYFYNPYFAKKLYEHGQNYL